MPLFEPPYFPFAASEVSGNPTRVDRSDASMGHLNGYIETDRSAPSAASLVASVGVDAGVPRDSNDVLLTRESSLAVIESIDLSTYFWSGGTFATAHTAAYLRLYVEEFDETGTFVGCPCDRGELAIRRLDSPWLGSESDSPGGRDWVIVSWGYIRARPGFTYHVWVDLHVEASGVGYGGFGGSGAIAQVFANVRNIEVNYVEG